METGAINVSKKFGVIAYQDRLAMEVLTCVNNLQRRCDMLEDATAILGCTARCSGVQSTNDTLLLDNHLQNHYLYTNMLANGVDGHPFIGHLHRSSINNNTPFLPSDIVNEQVASYVYIKQLRKRPASFPEEEIPKKKGKVNHSERPPNSLDIILSSDISALSQGDKEKLKAVKPKKGKDFLNLVKVEDGKHLAKSLGHMIGEEPDAKTGALEWQQCLSLLRSYGVIGNPDLGVRGSVNRRVPHPGYVGDGMPPNMCKICGMEEDPNNTVICDSCQEAFHLLCCVPRLTSKYFERVDNWFCASCRKQRRKIGSKFVEKGSTQEDKSFKCTKDKESKARIGPAYQADVPLWHERALDDDAKQCVEGCIGMEISLPEEQKHAEGDRLLSDFNNKLASLCWLPADKIPSGTSQNWVKCNNIIMRGHRTSDGRKQNEIRCGKWRRAPLHVEQTDDWECFCAIKWDPLHADCAIPQECSDAEVYSRIGQRLPVITDFQGLEAGGRKATLRQGKPAF